MSGPTGETVVQRIALGLWRASDLVSIAAVYAVGLALAVLPPKRDSGPAGQADAQNRADDEDGGSW